MIKKKDLVKQFELITQQEIKNHNDQILASNKAINKLKEELLILSKETSFSWTALIEKVNKIQQTQREDKEEIVKLNGMLSKKDRESAVIVNRNYREMSTLDQSIETTYRMTKQHSKELEGLVNYRRELAEKLERQKQAMLTIASQTKAQIKIDVLRVKDEILSMPSEALEVKKELGEELAAYKIDADGLMKEIKHLKKTNFIQEKKIENLYTLIERLEAKIKG
jgi:hypothetical protein